MPPNATLQKPRAKSQLAELLLGKKWYIHPDRLKALRAGIEAVLANPKALTAWAEAQVPSTYLTTQRDGIATVQINGYLERTFSWWSWYFGGTAYEVLAADMQRLRDDPSIRAVIAQFDTGGGQVAGCGECAEMIRSVAQVKPVISHAAGDACSAGYYLTAAGLVVVADPAAVLGSIGTCATYVDYSGMYEELGIDVIEVVSTQSPRKRLTPATPEGYADWQATLDSLADVFIRDLSLYRDVSVETVLTGFGKGGVFVGQEAIAAGLADALGTHDRIYTALREELDSSFEFNPSSFIERLTMSAAPKSSPSTDRPQAKKDATPAATADDTTTPKKEAEGTTAEEMLTVVGIQAPAHITASWLKANAPEVAAELQGEGATAERERIAAIQKLGSKVKGAKAEQMIAGAIADPKANADSLSRQLIEGGAIAGAATMAARDQDEEDLDAPSNAASGGVSDADSAAAFILSAGKSPKATR